LINESSLLELLRYVLGLLQQHLWLTGGCSVTW